MDFNILFFIQKIGEPLIPIMKFVSLLGYGELYIVLVAFLYWSINYKSAIRVGFTLFLGTQINMVSKLTLKSPRPYWLDSSISAHGAEDSFGMPSGHAQGSMLFWGQFAYTAKKNWFYIVTAVIIFLTGISRVILGVHFPSQVVVGWLLGFFTIVTANYFEKPFIRWFSKKRLISQLALILIFSSISIIYIGVLSYIQEPWSIPDNWINCSASLRDSFIGLIQVSGMLFGFISGAILLKRYFTFNSDGTIFKRGLRFLGGLIVIFSIWYGLKFDSYILQYLRSLLFGFSISFLWPWICIRIKLS